MKTTEKQKVLTYRRAEFLYPQPEGMTLQEYLVQAHSQYRVVKFSRNFSRAAHQNNLDILLFLSSRKASVKHRRGHLSRL